ncbi:PREDICTED: uncharacterized protein LOC109581911 [Amphimedon queenslandica]|uniref:IgGFc-binding protein N-terminal domain-containing protein n=1 Tax=Amphimedon queenslandica TaxID=400682 RepID=A0A1X7UVA2_AMPQE|nr:PREDICTED: uncharacterized protein LOC109581911 [Amphimedon queenslandica]|eukprot:XP_019851950.1 PREDICTED: uncharacterized protein LOC109581911 [Amphimedon queenslandica]
MLLVVFLLYSFLIVAGSASTAPTNFGTNFQLGFLRNYRGLSDTKLGFYITSNCTHGLVNITILYYEPSVTSISEVFSCESYFEVKDLPLSLMTSSNSGYRQSIKISTVNSSQYISVLAYNWQNGSVGEYMGLPCVDSYPVPIKYEYYLVSVQTPLHEHHQLWSEALIISCRSNTSITITPAVGMSLPEELGSDVYVWVEEGGSHDLVLDSGDSLYIGAPNSDITGSHIASSGPLTVISGHECANIPTDRKYCDHFVQQIPPAMTWGKEFFLSPFLGKENGQYYKIVTSRNGSVISHNCNEAGRIYLPYAGDYAMIHVNSTTSCYLASNVPILVVQIATSSGIEECTSGDPFLVTVQPTEQYVEHFSFRIHSTDQFSKNFIGILTTNPSLVLYDGVPLLETKWIPIHSLTGTISGYSYHFEGSSGLHSVSFTRGSGTVFLYGYQCDPERGYGYTASVQFKQLHATGPKVHFVNEIEQKEEEDWQYLQVSIGGDHDELFKLTIGLALNVTVQEMSNGRIYYQIYPVVNQSNTSSILQVKFNIQTIINALQSPIEGDRYNVTVALTTDSKGSFIASPSVLRFEIEIPSVKSVIAPTLSSISAIQSTNSQYKSSSFQFSSSGYYSSHVSPITSVTTSPVSSTGSLPSSSLLILTEGAAQRPPDQQLLYFIVLSVITAVLFIISIVALMAVVMVVILRRQKLMSRDCEGKVSAVNPITTEG